MTATTFEPGTIFTLMGIDYYVDSKTNLPCDNRYKCVNTTRLPKNNAEFDMLEKNPEKGWFALTELQTWRKKGIISNIINPTR